MFLLCLIGLGESMIHHPHRPHYWGHYYDRNDACISKVINEDVPLQILTLRRNSISLFIKTIFYQFRA